MPKLSDIEIGPNDILIPDVDDAAIADFRRRAEPKGQTFADYVVDMSARGTGRPRERLACASAVVLDEDT